VCSVFDQLLKYLPEEPQEIVESLLEPLGRPGYFKQTLDRFKEYSNVEDSIINVASILLDRLLKTKPQIVSKSTLRRIMSVLVLIACRVYSGGAQMSLIMFSRIAGVSEEDAMESQLFILNKIFEWKVSVDPDYFQEYSKKLNSI